jgi:hypothetical protein
MKSAILALMTYVAVSMGDDRLGGAYIEPRTGVAFPPALGGLMKGTQKDYQNPALGVSIPYAGTNGVTADIYIYGGGLASIPSGTNSVIVRNEFEKSAGVITAYEKMGAYQDVKRVSEAAMRLGVDEKARAMLALCFEYTVTLEGKEPREARSYLFLTGYKNQFLKIRFTFPRSNAESAEKNLKTLMEELGRLL